MRKLTCVRVIKELHTTCSRTLRPSPAAGGRTMVTRSQVGGHGGGGGGGSGWKSPLLWATLTLLFPAAHTAATRNHHTTTNNHYTSLNDIEAFVKKLEYEAVNGVDETLEGEVVPVDLNLLPDDVIAQDILDGLQEEFSSVDKELGENTTKTVNATSGPQSRQLSLIFQGVYAPDARFNAFVDGVMVNMVAEMKRKRMDPLYFRVYDRGIIEHVSTRAGREDQPDVALPAASVFTVNTTTQRQGRQSGSAIGGGVIRGLTNVKRFGNAEVQIAGNLTLVRSHYVYGPLNIELVFHTDKGVKTINSTLTAVAAHAVAEVNDNSSKLIDFIIDSPAEYEVRLVGARSQRYQRISLSVLMRLFKPTGRLERRLQRVYVRARSRRIPDVVARSQRRNNQRNSTKNGEATRNRQGNRNSNQKGDNQGVEKEHSQEPLETPELP